MTSVVVEPIAVGRKAALAHVLQLYLYDFTEFEFQPIREDGTHPYRYLDEYWAPAPGEGRHAYFIRCDGAIAGFAMVRVVNGVNVMSEFFVMRPYRRRKVGEAAARLVFHAHAGRWLVNEVATNLPAQAFWRRVIHDLTGGGYREEVGADGHVSQRFTIAAPDEGRR